MIKPYYETDLGKLYHGECLKILPQLTEQVDLVLTDPPYGVGINYEEYEDSEDNLSILIEELMKNLLPLSKRILITCGHTNIHKYPPYDWLLAWVYGTTNQRNKWGFTSWQPILAYGKDCYLANGKGARMDVIYDSKVPEKSGHPCPKPLTFWQKLLLRGSIEKTDLVLDPFLGSGTTAVACERLGRRWIGIEISKEYCDIAVKRIERERAQLKLNLGE